MGIITMVHSGDIALQTRMDSGFARHAVNSFNRVYISEDPIGFRGGDYNLFRHVWNDAQNWRDPLGMWGVSIGFYYGYGGTVTFGQDAGKYFVVFEGGVGIGGKLTYKPVGTFPEVPNKNSCDAGAFIGASAGAGVNILPVSLSLEGKAGLGISKTGTQIETSYKEKLSPEIGLKKTWGIGAGIHGGVLLGVLF